MFTVVANYDKDEQARAIKAAIGDKCVIVDSSGKQKEGFIATDTPFGTVYCNKALELFLGIGLFQPFYKRWYRKILLKLNF